MHLKECAECGRAFGSRRSDAVYCSENCKKKAKRKREQKARRKVTAAGRIVAGDSAQVGSLAGGTLPPIPPESYDDVAEALDDARRVSNRFSQLAFTAPTPCKPGCARISDAITGAIEREGW